MQPDRSYSMVIHKPPVSYFLRMAAGIKKGAMKPGFFFNHFSPYQMTEYIVIISLFVPLLSDLLFVIQLQLFSLFFGLAMPNSLNTLVG